ncbi:glycosyltransferase family 39 protein [Ensifer sp. LCM 4579]|uniref:ArnT family glycosyltransferase n=1 Tax=Ensifer sp. LCM 4579 TaxID=1848292 RepID=UPI0008DA8B14|nr:glycosyltransferase family 39 protein [Ensifer sp. LCM 4579]OHV75362.1 glycosyltransferase [Ensifer sp. LCM 4579]
MMLRYLALALFSLLLTVPGLWTVPPLDRDEARYVQATKQMIETGDYGDIRFQETSRYKKPIGIYWLQAGAVTLSGQGEAAPIWIYRLVSVFSILLVVLSTYWAGSRLYGNRAGIIAALIIGGIWGAAFEGRVAKTDAMLLACAVIAQGALAQIYVGVRKQETVASGMPWLFWAAQAVGVLIKGPVTPFLAVTTAATLCIFDRDWRWLRQLKPLRGLLVALLLVSPWLVWITWESGGAFWQEALGKDILGKVARGQESHGAPPGYFALTYSLYFWPFGLLALGAGFMAMNGVRGDPRLRFCLAWYIPFWLAIELVPTKLPHYALPAYPALALLTGWAMALPADETVPLRNWQHWIWRLAAAGSIVVTIGLAGSVIGMPIYLNGWVSPLSFIAAGAVLLAGYLAFPRGKQLQAGRICLAALSAGLAYAFIFGQVLPSLTPIWLSSRIAVAFNEHKPRQDAVLASVRFHEPSLVFLAGTKTALTDIAGAARLLRADPSGAMALIPDEDESAFRATVGPGYRVEAMSKIAGINYSSGDRLALTLYRVVEQ